MIVLDTHVWVWWVSNPEKLSRGARGAISEAMKNNAVLISAISVWEVALLVARERLKLSIEVVDWIARSERLPFVRFIPVDTSIALKTVFLPGHIHNDPADRIIIATALIAGAQLISMDKKIRKYPHVKTIW